MEPEEAFARRTGIHRIELPTPFIIGPVNVYLWMGDPITLIDTGIKGDASLDKLELALRGLGVSLEDIGRIVITHHHIDHCGQLKRLLDISGAESWMHPRAPEQSRRSDGDDEDDERKQFYNDLMLELGVPQDIRDRSMQLWGRNRHLLDPISYTHSLDDGGSVGPFRAHYVPGHSATDTLLVNEAEGYTIVGDHILETFNPNPLLRRPEPGQPREPALIEYQASIARARAMRLGRCLPGHGAPFDDAERVIAGIIEQHEKRNQQLLEAMPPEGMTPYDGVRILYPTIPAKHLYLGLSVATGQLEVLEAEGKMESSRENSVLRYRRV